MLCLVVAVVLFYTEFRGNISFLAFCVQKFLAIFNSLHSAVVHCTLYSLFFLCNFHSLYFSGSSLAVSQYRTYSPKTYITLHVT